MGLRRHLVSNVSQLSVVSLVLTVINTDRQEREREREGDMWCGVNTLNSPHCTAESGLQSVS